MMGSKAFESPLISHARMRALYRGLVELKVLSEVRLAPILLEEIAALIATAIDLKPGDFVSEGSVAGSATYVRKLGAREGSGATKAADIRALQGVPAVSSAGSAFERMLCATGAAMALRDAGAGGIALAYSDRNAMSRAEWRKLLTIAGVGALPLILVTTGSAGIPLERLVADLAANSPGFNLPVIPVDGSDVLAIYRVAQESIGRARAEGGTVVIECVPGERDPATAMGDYLVRKGICTSRWVADVPARFGALAHAALTRRGRTR